MNTTKEFNLLIYTYNIICLLNISAEYRELTFSFPESNYEKNFGQLDHLNVPTYSSKGSVKPLLVRWRSIFFWFELWIPKILGTRTFYDELDNIFYLQTILRVLNRSNGLTDRYYIYISVYRLVKLRKYDWQPLLYLTYVIRYRYKRYMHILLNLKKSILNQSTYKLYPG